MRVRSLDGLRGVAAFVVLIHHSLLVFPGLAAPYFGEPVEDRLSPLVYSPLHLVWAGTEAVYLFFVLSGLVLAFAVRSASFDWGAYFPSRAVRLYLPVFGAIVLGGILIALTPPAEPGDSPWITRRTGDYDLRSILTDAVLIGGSAGRISPLWSLQWEVLFSFLLPLYIYVSRRLNGGVQIGIGIALATVGSYADVAALKYLPMFGIGVGLASLWEALSARVQKAGGRRAALGWPAAVALAVLLVTSNWMVKPFLPATAAATLTLPLILIGVLILIVAAAHAPVLSRVLGSRPFAFLGLISFSLYLVHEPIVVALEKLMPTAVSVVLVAVPVSLVVATAFWWAVERPAHRLARSITSGSSNRLGLAA